MSPLQMVPSIPTPPADLIRVAVPRLNKQEHISRYLAQLETRDYDILYARVTETKVLTCSDWNEFVTNLMTDRDWLAGKGGASSWAFENDLRAFYEMSQAEQDLARKTSFIFVVQVVCAGQVLYVDPEGYDYARYLAFPAVAMMEGKTREQMERERAKTAADERIAELALRIATPPAVPRDHGLRFLWNCIKHEGKTFHVSWSMGTMYPPWPAGTITAYARDYRSCPESIAKYFQVENNSDGQTDYFENDKMRICPNHPLYALAKTAYDAQETHHTKMRAKRG